MIYLGDIRRNYAASGDFPFCIPAFADFQSLSFTSPVSFFVGANASGKSTLLESIAIATNRVVVGGKDLKQDRTLDAIRPLAAGLTMSWKQRSTHGFFFRSEDFFNFIKRNRELCAELDGFAEEFKASDAARGYMLGQKQAIESRYGDLNARSHGEGFLDVFKSRLTAGGLYLLDEPEAALSPVSQLSLLYLIQQMVEEEGAQFIIATHSPILMSYPDAQVFSFDNDTIREEAYENLEHVNLYKRFLADPQKYLGDLFRD